MRTVAAILATLSMIVPIAGMAESLVAKAGGDVLTITQDPCPLGDWFKDWKLARWIYQGKDYQACWRVIGNAVIVIDSAGDLGSVPITAFKKEEGV